MATRMQQRRGTAAQWTAANPTLAAGEIGFETDTNKFKVGNGSSAWTSLAYFVDASVVFDSSEVQSLVDAGVASLVGNAPNALNTIWELANAINQDANYAYTVSTSINGLQNTIAIHGNSISDLTSNVTNLTANTTSEISWLTGNASAHTSANTSVHGISNTLNLVYNNNAALTNERTPVDLSVTEGKIANSAVTAAKLASDAVETGKIVNSAVTEAKIADGAVTSAKIAEGTIVNADINASAAIAQSKIANLTTDLGLLASQSSVDLKAPLASPALTGTPTAPTAAAATNTTQIATTEFVRTEVAALVNSAGSTLDTLGEIATALGNDANLSSTLTTSIGLKAPLASPTFTGTVTVAASGIAFTDGTQTKEGVPSRTPIISKTASYTLTSTSERDSLIEVDSASGTTITIPLNSAVAYPVGTTLDILQTGTGQVTIAGDSGVTVNSTPGLKLRTRWSSCTLFKRATDSWVVFGDLSA